MRDPHGRDRPRGATRQLTTIAVPDPALVVLIGPAGAGKTTFAARHFGPEEVLSSDALRAFVSGDEADQSATRSAFSILHRQVFRRLVRRQLTVVDATNVEAHARRALLTRAATAGVPAVAIVFDLPPDLVLARNAVRATRVVDPGVVAVHLDLLRRALDRGVIDGEGFAAVHRLMTASDVDSVRIQRDRHPPA